MFTTVLVLLSTWKNRMRWLLLPWLVMQIASLMALCSCVLYSGVMILCYYTYVTTPRPPATTLRRPNVTQPRMLPQFTTPRSPSIILLQSTTRGFRLHQGPRVLNYDLRCLRCLQLLHWSSTVLNNQGNLTPQPTLLHLTTHGNSCSALLVTNCSLDRATNSQSCVNMLLLH
jgi:hypothetical protein